MYGNYIDEPVMTYSGGVYFYVQDHLYSTAALVDASGTPQERYEYDAYGQVHILDANFADDADGVSDCGNPYMFTGRRVDFLDGGKLTLQVNRHRYYDYYTGRWLTEDPLGMNPASRPYNRFSILGQYLGGLSLYEYTKSSPSLRLDFLGLRCGECFPPLPPGRNAYYPQIVEWGRTSGAAGSPQVIKDLKHGVRLLDAAGGLAAMAQTAAALGVSISKAIHSLVGSGGLAISASLLTEVALDRVDWIEAHVTDSVWSPGWYLWARVRYKVCVPCTPINPCVFAKKIRGCMTYKWKTEKKWHKCLSTFKPYHVGAIPNASLEPNRLWRAEAFWSAVRACERSAEEQPDDPPSAGPILGP